MSAKRPNFLFIITDQQRADHMSCAGNQVLKTPHMDSLANLGRRFENFYVNSGICQTNRATIMTGQTITQHGVRVNGIPMALDSVCYTHLLKAGGYQTALFGKAHFQNMTTDRPNFRQASEDLDPPPEDLRDSRMRLRSGPEYDRELSFEYSADPEADEVQGDYYGFENFRVCTWHGDDVQGHYSHWLRERFEDEANNRSSVNPEPDPRYNAPQARKPRMPEELYPTNYVTEMTLDYLDSYAAGMTINRSSSSVVSRTRTTRSRRRVNTGTCMIRRISSYPTLSTINPTTKPPSSPGCIMNWRKVSRTGNGCGPMR